MRTFLIFLIALWLFCIADNTHSIAKSLTKIAGAI